MSDHYGAIHSPPERSNPDNDTDDWYARIDMQKLIDRGEVCPTCAQAIQALRVQALGVPLFECLLCRSTWFDCTEKTA